MRIDNGDELRRALGADRSQPDHEVIVDAYLRWGPSCADRIVGDFALAIWDERRHRMFCARDAFGVRPLYYSWKPGRVFAFGSDMGAVLALDEVTTDVNEAVLADLIEGNLEDHTTTLYRDVFRLPPAHHLVADAVGLRIARYWQFDRRAEIRLGSDREYEEGYRSHLVEAVRCRMPENGRVGAMLSGGIDSSSIACIARDLATADGLGPLPTFSNLFSDTMASDERAYIQAVLDTGGFSPYFGEGGRHDPLGSVDELLAVHRVPFLAANSFLVSSLAEQARQQGVEVLLDGFGGDSTTSHGWLYLRELANDMRLVRLGREFRAFGPHLGMPWPRAVARHVWKYGLTSRVPGPARRLSRRLTRPERATVSILDPGFAARTEGLRSKTRSQLYGPALTARDQHFYEMTTGMMAAGTEVTDRLARSIGIEFRYPFFDRRLAEFCLALPPEQKLRDGWTRSIARRALDGVLPDEVRWRGDKADLSHNFIHLLQTRSRGALETAIHTDPGPLDGVVNVAELRATLGRLDAGSASPDDAQLVWVAAIVRHWLR